VINFVSDYKTGGHDITDILLKVVLNTQGGQLWIHPIPRMYIDRTQNGTGLEEDPWLHGCESEI
jgi:hypothetical protein